MIVPVSPAIGVDWVRSGAGGGGGGVPTYSSIAAVSSSSEGPGDGGVTDVGLDTVRFAIC